MKLNFKNLFRKKPNPFPLQDGKYRIIEAFELEGEKYYQFDNTFDMPAGRALSALTFYEEFRMRCTHEYLQKHVRAVELILSDPKKINLSTIVVLNNNLKERLSLVPFPEHLYRLASVNFFILPDENPYSYDFAYNQKKIAKWKKTPGTLDFFLTNPMKDLLPSLNTHGTDFNTFFQTLDQVNNLHQKDLRTVLSKEG